MPVDARSERRAPPPGQRSTAIDPALVALAWAALAAMLLAVRFLWLAFFPLLLISRTWAERSSAARVPAWTGWLPALLGPALLAGFVWIGPWPRISDVLDLSFAQWAEPYAAEKYPVEAIWLMRDAGLAGRLFTEYSLGGYAGFWLAPKIETFVNGSLNFAPDTASEYIAIRKRLPAAPGESFPELLDRLELDLFLGTGTPAGPHGPSYTVAHLERTPGWIAIFRNATSALYLRVGAPDSANLRQVADYYAREGIPFDPERGFEPARVIRDHEPWAVEHRVIPRTFAAIERAAIQPGAPLARPRALVQTASFYALLGACDLALEREALIRSIDALAVGSRRRTVWCLLRAGRYEDARAQAAALDGLARADELARITVELARAIPTLSADVRESMVRRLPLLSPAQAQALAFSLETPPARVR
ncbi:MAG: hypothetical protein E6J87_26515 [Deltaproteobacteria bacterium]|nr:MAG: hypothetical protein E6J87_26515 [Deltaproteobacteria bacterium]